MYVCTCVTIDEMPYVCCVKVCDPYLSQDGETPLHCASWHGFQAIVECLVHYGCSLDVVNKDCETALHIAAVRGYCNIVKFLCQSNCSVNKQDKVLTCAV